VFRLYRIATALAALFLPLWLLWRQYKGKEDKARLNERFGITDLKRPEGLLVWFHAASVGEANSVLVFIYALLRRFPEVKLLVTTGTVTSANLMARRLPKGVIHQYVPIDTPMATNRFIRHWKPDLAFWVESELWPNLILAARMYYCFMGIINGRMSERSLAMWQKYSGISQPMLSYFSVVFPQSEADGERFIKLGVPTRQVLPMGNLKYDGAPLGCNEEELLKLSSVIGIRPCWLAASTHPGEEEMVLAAHKVLTATRRNLLTVIVPRHARRGAEIAKILASHGPVALRSRGDTITEATQFYIADTMGELGLFYRLCEIGFIGGSLVPHGGQNPLEAARLSCCVITGPHTHNFTDMYEEMEAAQACIRVTNPTQLAAQVDGLLNDGTRLSAMQTIAGEWLKDKGGATGRILDTLTPVLEAKPA